MLRYDLSERRRSLRIYAKIPLICEIINPDKSVTKKSVMASNINAEGLCFDSEETIPLSTLINVNFKLPKAKESISAVIKVVRTEILDGESICGIGTVFVNLMENDRVQIKELVERLDINKLLELAIQRGASDLHLLAEQSPVLRVNGEIEVTALPKLDAGTIPSMIYSLATRQQIKKFEKEKELDFGVQFDFENRFRVNVYQQRGFVEATLRLINTKISSFDDLNLPEAVKDLAMQKDGLVLVLGPTGSGKTTTIAAIIEYINQLKKSVIITLERPIEYVHANNKSIIKQREVGVDTFSFSAALRNTLRQDPNIIVIGELDDMETVKTALDAAETGYLVIASFHAPSIIQGISRIADMFPVEHRKTILNQLSQCLRGGIFQILVPRKDRRGRILASEVLVVNDAVKKVIRSDELLQLPTIIQTGGTFKMQTISDSLAKLELHGLIDNDTVKGYSLWKK